MSPIGMIELQQELIPLHWAIRVIFNRGELFHERASRPGRALDIK